MTRLVVVQAANQTIAAPTDIDSEARAMFASMDANGNGVRQLTMHSQLDRYSAFVMLIDWSNSNHLNDLVLYLPPSLFGSIPLR